MTDRELLELAAKAAGIKGTYRVNGYRNICGISETMDSPLWNPLIDDGDALRLAVKLKMDINVYKDEIGAVQHNQHGGNYRRHFERNMSDRYAATRRAIVRAAAEIGKGMKNETL